MCGQETSEPEVWKHGEEAREQDGHGEPSVVNGDETNGQEEPTERRVPITNIGINGLIKEKEAQRSLTSTGPPEEQKNVETLIETAPEQYTMIDEGDSDMSLGDPITSRRTLDFVEDVLTPMQTTPMEIAYETIANAWDHRAVQQQSDWSSSTTSPGLQDIFDEWLV